MKLIKVVSLALIPFTLVACNPFNKHVKCNDESAVTLITDVLKKDLTQTLENNLKTLIQNDQIKDLDPAKLKVLAQGVQYNLADSRTEFVDPNSPKTTCEIDLTITMPSDLIKKSNQAREKRGEVSVEDAARSTGIHYENNKISMPLTYVIQPTDKGDKILASVKDTEKLQDLLSETITYAFLKPQIDKNEIQQVKAAQAYENTMVADEGYYDVSSETEYYEGY